jgi:hypothetical protein
MFIFSSSDVDGMVRTLDQYLPAGKYERISIPEPLIKQYAHSAPVVEKSAPVCLDDLSDEALDVLEASHPVAAKWGYFLTAALVPTGFLWNSRGVAPNFALFYHNRAGPDHSCEFSKYLDSQSEEAT